MQKIDVDKFDASAARNTRLRAIPLVAPRDATNTLPTDFLHEMKRYRLPLVVERCRYQLPSDINNEFPGT